MEYIDHLLLKNNMQEENTYQPSSMYTFFEGLDNSAVI